MSYTWTTGETITAEKLNATDGLPTVTSSDNGKVLSVVNGAWAASDFFFEIEFNDDSGYLNKTFAEISSALVAGKMCRICMSRNEGVYFYVLLTEYDEDQELYFVRLLGMDTYWFQTNSTNGYPSIVVD